MFKKLISLLLCIFLLCAGAVSCLASEETEVTASDYSDRTNWLAIPMVSHEVDTFYIYPTAVNDASEGAVAINPLNWKRDETYAGREECRGARIQNAETGKYELIPEAADAQLNVARGVVVTHTDALAPMDAAMGFGPESYHGGDYTLWYTNIRDNVKVRADAWLKAAESKTGDAEIID